MSQTAISPYSLDMTKLVSSISGPQNQVSRRWSQEVDGEPSSNTAPNMTPYFLGILLL